jgi:ABC-type transport system involved in multi-copper enzyme maturation permease subunit
MVAALISSVFKFASLSWLTGPIFDKELRVSARRRRNYVLRFVYLILLTAFLALIWLNEVRIAGSAAFLASQMARAGQNIVTVIVWFQFCAAQVVAIIMLSTSISDEIYNRTLGVLMTTPINSFQIVMGKVFSKLLQLVLLLAITFPLLAIVRVFGGVPWAYIISGTCITLTAVIFVGSLSLFFSIFSRRPYVVIISTVLTLGAVMGLPLLWLIVVDETVGLRGNAPEIVIGHLNPYFMLSFATDNMFNPIRGGAFSLSWPVHCSLMLAASVLVLTVAVRLVRKVAMRQAVGQLNPFAAWWSACKRRPRRRAVSNRAGKPIRRVIGPAVIWRELVSPISHRQKLTAGIVIGIELVLLAVTFLFPVVMDIVGYEGTHVVYALLFGSVAMLFTIILPATCITAEKESRCWPLLLATTVSDWQIIFGKFVGALRRFGPMWLLFLAYIVLFVHAQFIHYVAVFQIAMVATWVTVFLACTGLYFSSRCRHTTTAVIMNFALAGTIWLIAPLLLAVADDHDALQTLVLGNPFVQIIVTMLGTASVNAKAGLHGLSYYWPHGHEDFPYTIRAFLATMLIHVSLGILFAWRAKCRLRRNIF